MQAEQNDRKPIAYITNTPFDVALHYVPTEELISGMNKAARGAGVWIYFYDKAFDLPVWYNAGMYRSFAGLIFTITDESVVWKMHCRRLSKVMPCVRCKIPAAEKSAYVGVDEAAGIDVIVKHLADEGHNRIGFMTSDNLEYTVARRKAFLAAMKRYGLSFAPEWMYEFRTEEASTASTKKPLAHIRNSSAVDFLTRYRDSAIECAAIVARQKKRPEALVCTHDLLAFNLIEALKRHSIRVPHDIAITGFNDDAAFDVRFNSLTSVHQDYLRIGHESVSLLLEMIRTPRRNSHPVRLIPPTIVIRRSSLKRSLGLKHDDAFRARVYDYLKSYYADTKAIHHMHEIFGISRDHFSKRFKRAYSRTVTDVVNEYRLSIAADLLKYSDTSITDIYLNCGFDSHQHFSTMFKRAYTMVPTAYRAAHGAGIH